VGPAFRLAILPANLTLLPAVDLRQPSSPAINLDAPLRGSNTPQRPSAPAKVLKQGSRVRIEGLWSAPQHNGRTGVICHARSPGAYEDLLRSAGVNVAFNQEKGLWAVEVDASTAGPAFRISVPPENLALLPAVDLSHLPQRPPPAFDFDALLHAIDQPERPSAFDPHAFLNAIHLPQPSLPAMSSAQSAPPPSYPEAAALSPAPAAATLQQGSRVRIEGLQAKPQHNGRTGVVCSAFNQESGRWAVEMDASAVGPAFRLAILPANLTLLPAVDLRQPSSPAINLDAPLRGSNPPQRPSAPAKVLKQGSRVRIEGLYYAPDMNGRTGVICGALGQESGLWTVDIAADGTKPAFRGSFIEANLCLISSHNFSTEWVDDDGLVWPKNVDFSRECAKGHALVPRANCGVDGGSTQLMCRLCHCFCRRDCDEAANWLTCSVDAGCCGEYAVCCSCARSPSAPAAVSVGADDFRTLVS
jgi:hypothetical protein